MTKTINLDKEAYEILKSHKDGDESFSDVIKKSMARAGDWPSLFKKYGVKANRKKHARPARRQ
jgi:predicted CopG family antitoxin